MSQHTELIDELRKSSASDSAWNLGILCQRAADALQAMERVPMTEEQIRELWEDEDHVLNFARAIEARSGITQPESKG